MTTDATEWTRTVRMGWNLGNSMESAAGEWDDATGTWKNVWQPNRNEWETAWGNPKTTKQMLQAVCDAGFDAVRIPVRWQPHITNENTMAIDDVWMSRVQQLVDWCLELNMKVILNTHHELWLENHPVFSRQDATCKQLAAIWRQIATRFRDYDERLAFAGVNEVQINWQAPTAENNAVMNQYNQTFVDAVRATGGRNYYRTLIVQTYSCNPHYGLSGLTIPTDVTEKRLAVEFHYYNPYNYCSGANGCFYYWGTAFQDKGKIAPETETALQTLFKQIRRKFYEQGIGVVVGEYGVSCHYTSNDRSTQEANMGYYLQCVQAEARKNGFAAFVWDNNAFGNGSEKYGIFDRNNNMSVKTPFMLSGIQEGAKAELEELNDTPTDYEGTVFWEGNAPLSWGDGLQLNIPASEFQQFTEDSRLVISFTQNPAAPYDDLQFCKGDDWSKVAFIVDGTTYEGDLNPRNVFGTTDGSYTIAAAFNSSSLAKLKEKGMYLQGFGLSLTQVLISLTGATGIKNVSCSPHRLSNEFSAIHTLTGQRAGTMLPGRIYITRGKKILR